MQSFLNIIGLVCIILVITKEGDLIFLSFIVRTLRYDKEIGLLLSTAKTEGSTIFRIESIRSIEEIEKKL